MLSSDECEFISSLNTILLNYMYLHDNGDDNVCENKFEFKTVTTKTKILKLLEQC